jgi:NADH:ubiquinone reductase (non-electrogenic)
VRQVLDAIELRKALVDCFERANLPSVAEEDKRRILSFVVVGGGPTGVEFAGEVRRKERNLPMKLSSMDALPEML